MKILNLYACLGGNRYKWGNEHQITAVELDEELARLYKERFPNDEVIVADAHQYLLDHYKEFDFIWSSPPCPTHSRARFARKETTTPEYPNMMLYQEIIFLDNWFNGKWIVENVIPYYEPLIPAKKIGRHLYWSNFKIQDFKARHIEIEDGGYKLLEKFHKIDLSTYKGKQSKTKIARNLVDYEAGKIILDNALNIISKSNINQTELF
jgi:DNA (cytosine-5)-methyltransferase 1